MGSFQKFCLKWNNHSSNFVGNLGSLLESEAYSDVTVCCQGQVWHLHQLVLSASSTHFAHLLRLIPAGQTPILILDGPPASDIEALIHFIYHGEVNIDQDVLPSLLRTASSFHIKGLADVTPSENVSVPFVINESFDPLVQNENLNQLRDPEVTQEAFEDATPLNLSCNKGIYEDNKMSISSSNDAVIARVSPHVDHPRPVVHDPPSKRIRLVEQINQQKQHAATIALLSPKDNVKHRQARIPSYSSNDNKLSVQESKSINECVKRETYSQELICSSNVVIEQKKNEAKCNLTSRASFPILKMALINQASYQPSSTSSPNAEHPSSVYEQKTTEAVVNGSFSPSAVVSNSVNDVCKYEIDNRVLYENEKNEIKPNKVPPVQNFCYNADHLKNSKPETKESEAKPQSQYVDAATNVTETTFTHKKFSVCTIPQFTTPTKTVHIMKDFSNKNNNSPPSLTQRKTSLIPGEVSPNIQQQSCVESQTIIPSKIVKLTPVSVTGFTASKYPPNSIIYSASIDSSHFNESTIISSTCPVSSESSSPLATMQVVTKSEVEQSSPYLQSLFRQVGSNEVPETTTSSTVQAVVGTTQNNNNNTAAEAPAANGTSNSSQRVTINMRTFKEEWRRQLLVDYDSNTNMSICMLCFTTFKSYDGPRKNTYVKHAKRFHPALDDYSDEERTVIISMYEKYHKYDIDKQKEINKSFRTTNGIGASLKRMRVAESLHVGHHPLYIQSDTDADNTDAKSDSLGESHSHRDSIESSPTRSEVDTFSNKKITVSSKRETNKDAPTNNNNTKLNHNRNEKTEKVLES